MPLEIVRNDILRMLFHALLAGAVCSPLAYGGGCSHVEAAEAVQAGAYQDAETDNLLLKGWGGAYEALGCCVTVVDRDAILPETLAYVTLA